MSDKQNTSKMNVGTFDNKSNKDAKGRQKQANEWIQGRNAVNNTVDGDIGELSNEASNILCTALDYTIIGTIHIAADEWVVFSTDDTTSEIGLFHEDSCDYITLIKGDCLNFDRKHLIKGIGRTAYNCGRRVYWDDGVNPTRTLDIDDIPYIQIPAGCGDLPGCAPCSDSTDLDCDKLRLAPFMEDLSFKIKQGTSGGQIINGSYYVVGAYLVEGVKVGDYSLPSNILGVFDHDNVSGAIDIFVEHADTSFEEFELLIVQFANFNTVVKKVGTYSTRQKKITLDSIYERWADIDPKLILINNQIPDKSDALYRAGDYMIRVGPTSKFDFNYQPLANQIVANWVVVQHSENYYKHGGTDIGYMRDEVYPFFIRWIYDTGDKSNSYHIPGRAAHEPYETEQVTGDDVFDILHRKRWQVYNTASLDTAMPEIGDLTDDHGIIVAGGEMAYWESTEIYPSDKPHIWNASSDPIWNSTNPAHDLCSKPIRHHKFPDNNTDIINNHCNHYGKNDSGNNVVNVLGVIFDNIMPPLDNAGNVITNIVGYEILRGSREGNKTILAKGMINNMREYVPVDSADAIIDPSNPSANKTFLYPNYPYNPTAADLGANTITVDHFLSAEATKYSSEHFEQGQGGLQAQHNAFLTNDSPLGVPFSRDGISWFNNNGNKGNLVEDVVTFHSPDTNFRNPYLAAKSISVYGEMSGEMIGRFELPKGHPQAKFITDLAFFTAALVGLGYALLSMEGEKRTDHKEPSMAYGGTHGHVGLAGYGSTGLAGVSAISSILQAISNTVATVVNSLANRFFGNSLLSTGLSIVGLNPNGIRDTMHRMNGLIAGLIGGSGGDTTYSHGQTGWSATPKALRIGSGPMSFITFWGKGINDMLDIIYAFTTYRYQALQQVSHCFYEDYHSVSEGNKNRAIENANYLNPHIQDFKTDDKFYKVNNLFRSRTVVAKLKTLLEVPSHTVDNSQALFSDVWDRGLDVERWQNDEHLNSSFKRNSSAYYVALKQRLDNQYGQIKGINQVPVSTKRIPKDRVRSPLQFNGDTYIGRYTEKNTMFFFYDWLNGQPDGATFNYKLRKMIPHPRFWMDTDRFDVGEFVSSVGDAISAAFGGGGSGANSFDPFATTDDSGAICTCEDTSGCLNNPGDPSDPNSICALQEEVDHQQDYVNYLKKCVCWVNDDSGDDPQCNNNMPATENPALLYPQFGQCQDLHHGAKSNSEVAAAYFTDKDDKWWNLIEQEKDVLAEKQQKLNDKKTEAFQDGIDDISSGGGDSVWDTFKAALETPSDHFGFDMRKDTSFRLVVKEAWMYLFVSGVRDFFVESEINIDFRDRGENPKEYHYDNNSYTDLRTLFNTDVIKVGNYMKYDYSLSISRLFNNFISWGQVQAHNYDPYIAETCYIHRPKRLIYSLPQSLENIKDNWRVFLPLNYKDFNSVTTSIKPISKNGALLLFENESPIQFLGVDQLETDAGTKITIGDGGLFSQPMQNLVNSEYPNEYGSCQNRLAVANTSLGLYFMSQNQGKIFQITGNGLRDISSQGMRKWFTKFLPYVLTQDPLAFVDEPYEFLDNPVAGIGCQIIYDNENQIVFFCKKDWKIRTDISDTLVYIGNNQFQVSKMLIVELGDPDYFESASWTVSWDPKINNSQGGWVSFHDWHPDLTLPSKRTYMTTKENGIWLHAAVCNSYCNFYGTDFPFEIEFDLTSETDVETLRNIVYRMAAYTYAENCTDRFHILDFNFDESIIYNTEQCSGLLHLNLSPKNDASAIVDFPRVDIDFIDILYSKEEQIYKFNQFWDITDDRGEFNPIAQRTIFLTEPNGYIKELNANNLNYNKQATQRKKFRHFKHNVILRRTVSGDVNMIISVVADKTLQSPR